MAPCCESFIGECLLDGSRIVYPRVRSLGSLKARPELPGAESGLTLGLWLYDGDLTAQRSGFAFQDLASTEPQRGV